MSGDWPVLEELTSLSCPQSQRNMSDCSDSQSVSDRDSQDGEETWDDWTEEPQRAQSLFDDSTHPSPQAALQHDKQQHGVDLALIASTLGQPSHMLTVCTEKSSLGTERRLL